MSINDLTNTIQGIKDAKEELRGAINAKGGTLADDAKLSEFAEKVREIKQGEDNGWNTLVELVDPNVFSVRNLRKITFKQGIKKIHEAVNGGTSLEEIVFNDDLEIIGDNAFRGCTKLTSIIIPDSVQQLGNSAFYNCSNLESVGSMPSNLITIVNGAFLGCSKIDLFDFRKVTIVPKMTNINAFTDTTGVMVVPDTLHDKWVSETNWAAYADRIIKASEYTES